MTDRQKHIIESRYLSVVESTEKQYNRVRISYYALTNIVTIAGVLLTALNPLTKMEWIGDTGDMIIFWIIWALAIMLTLSNKWLYAFNIPKKYILNIVTLEKFRSEGWLFIAKVGRYAECDTHDERFVLFCERVEKIKDKAVESTPEMSFSGAAGEILATGTGTAKSIMSEDDSSDPDIIAIKTRKSSGGKSVDRHTSTVETSDIDHISTSSIIIDVDNIAADDVV